MLKDLLQLDKNIKKGVYDLYLTEAKSRNLDFEFLEYLKPENAQDRSILDMFSLKIYLTGNSIFSMLALVISR
jgi:hypothetical protein